MPPVAQVREKKDFHPVTKLVLIVAVFSATAFGLYALGVFGSTTVNLTLNSNADLSRGLVGHWTFDGDLGTQITDHSGTGNTMYFENAATTSLVAVGKMGQGMTTRTGGRAYANSASTLNFNDGEDFSISLWINMDVFAVGGNNSLLSKFNGGDGYNIQMPNDKFGFLLNDKDGTQVGQTNNGTALTAGEWYNLVIVFDRDGFAYRYVNGEPYGTDTDISTINDMTNSGVLNVPVHTEIKGEIDDLRIYNRVLTPEEVKRLYHLGATTHINTTVTTNPDLESGLVGHWTFDGPDIDPSSSTVFDRSGNEYDGTYSSNVTIANGIIGQGLHFDGFTANTARAIVNDAPELVLNANFTMAAWIKVRDKDELHVPVKQGGGSSNGSQQRYAMNIQADDDLAFLTKDDTDVCGSYTSYLGEWYHVVMVEENDTKRCYVDGIQFGSTHANDATEWTTGDGSLYIGANNHPTGHSFNGVMDDVRIYNRVLPDAEIKRLYELGATTHINTTITTNPDLGSGLVGHWTFDGKDMYSNAADRSGEGNHGYLSGQTATTTAIGKIGQALSFDGVDDYVDVGEAGASSVKTIAFWIKAATSTSNMKIADLGATDIVLNGSSEITSTNFLGSPVGTIYVDGSTASAVIPDLEWHHVAITDLSGGASTSHIGRVDNDRFGGLLDDVRIYSRLFSADEIKRLYELSSRR